MKPSKFRVVVMWVVLVVVSLGVRILQLRSGLPSINRFHWETDEGTVLQNALVVGSGRWYPGNFSNAHLYVYLLTGVFGIAYGLGHLGGVFKSPVDFAVSYWTDPSLFYLLARGVSALAGAVTVGLTYLLTRRAFGEIAAWFAAILMAALPQHVALSQHAEPDALAAMLSTLSLVLLLRPAPLTMIRILQVGFVSGLAASAKYNGGVTLIALVIAHLIDHRTEWRSWGVHIPLLGGLLSFVAGFVVGSPAVVVHSKDLLRAFSAIQTLWGGEGSGYFSSALVLCRDILSFGPGYFALVACGIGLACIRRTRTDMVLLSVIILNYLVIAKPGYRFNPEYLLPSFPAMMALVGRALAEWKESGKMQRILLQSGFAITVASALVIDGLGGLKASDTTYLAAKRWIEAHIPAGTGIAMQDRQMPQLTFTPESLARRRAWGPRPSLWGMLSPGQYHEVGGSRLAQLRDQTLTTGVPYEIHFLVPRAYSWAAPDLFPFWPSGLKEQLQIQVVVTAESGRHLQDDDRSVAEFYRALQHEWRCVAEFQPGITRSGVPLWVYGAPDFADQLGLSGACSVLARQERQRVQR